MNGRCLSADNPSPNACWARLARISLSRRSRRRQSALISQEMTLAPTDVDRCTLRPFSPQCETSGLEGQYSHRFHIYSLVPARPILAEYPKVGEIHFVISVQIPTETTSLFEPIPTIYPQIQEVHMAVEVEVAHRRVEQRNVIQINVCSRSPQVED